MNECLSLVGFQINLEFKPHVPTETNLHWAFSCPVVCLSSIYLSIICRGSLEVISGWFGQPAPSGLGLPSIGCILRSLFLSFPRGHG